MTIRFLQRRWPHPPPMEGLAESVAGLAEAREQEQKTLAALRRRRRETVKNHFASDVKKALGLHG